MRGARHNLAVAGGACLALTVVLCGRSWGPGLYLYRDFVTVPEPVWGAATRGADGPPRAVPLDAVMTALAAVVPTGVQQQVMLGGAVFLAGLGVAALVRRWGLAAMLAGAVVAMWNPYVAERLLVGQPPTLLAYAAAPWLVAVVRSRLSGWRAWLGVLAGAAPAVVTPWGGLAAAGVLLGTSVLTPHRRRGRWLSGCAAIAVAWCLPWVVAALGSSARAADVDGARAFAVASDSALGVLGSALTLGGIWAPAAQPASRGSAGAVVATCLLLLLAVAGAEALRRRGYAEVCAVLSAMWVVPPVLVWLLSTGPGLAVFATLQSVPGVAIGRDTHRLLGLSALAVAILVAAAVRHSGDLRVGGLRGRDLRGGEPQARSAARAGAAAAVAASLAVLSVPDLPVLLHAAYRPVRMPSDWEPTVRAAAAAAGDGLVVSLPWQPFRQTEWAGPAPFLDPLPRALSQRVATSHQLTVLRGGRRLTVDDETGGWPRAEATVVVVWRGTPGELPGSFGGMTVVSDTEHFTVWARPPA